MALFFDENVNGKIGIYLDFAQIFQKPLDSLRGARFHWALSISKLTTDRNKMLRIRLQRHGSTHAPIYRLAICESSARRDGRFVEVIGSYNPSAKGKAVGLSVDLARADYWIKCGAQPSETVRSLIKRARKEAAAAEPAVAA